VTNDSLVAAQRAGPGRGRPTPGLGRWSVVAAARAGDRDDDVCRILRVLLSRYGFLSRELVDRESIGLRWNEAYPALQRMEWRGDVERGVYVSDLSGPQFAVAGWHHALRDGHEAGGPQLLHVMDPANLLGDVGSIARVPRRGPGNYVVVRGGQPLVAVEARARRLVPLADLSAGERREALSLLVRLVRRAGQRPSIRVETWDGVPAAASEVAGDLATLGFIRDDQAMVLYRSFRGPT
jgi:ATP-dependent Lhr-like helicase